MTADGSTHVDDDGLRIPPELRDFQSQVVFRTPRCTIQHFESGEGQLDPYYGLIDESHFGDVETFTDPKNPELAPDRVSIKPQGEDAVILDVDIYSDPEVVADGGREIPRLEAAEGEICTGAIVVDLSSGKGLQVVGKSAKTVGEHRQTRSDATAEMFGADPDEAVFECVFLPDGEKVTPPSKTYAYPESRLLWYPVENATEHAGGIQMWLRSAFIDELAEGVSRRVGTELEWQLRDLLADVYSEDLAETFDELVEAHLQEAQD